MHLVCLVPSTGERQCRAWRISLLLLLLKAQLVSHALACGPASKPAAQVAAARLWRMCRAAAMPAACSWSSRTASCWRPMAQPCRKC